MPLMTTMYFMYDTVINTFNSNFDKNYSNDFQKLSISQKLEIQNFLCENTNFAIHLTKKDERIGVAPSQNITHFDSDCYMMKDWWAYGKLRVQRHIGMGARKDKLTGSMWKLQGI